MDEYMHELVFLGAYAIAKQFNLSGDDHQGAFSDFIADYAGDVPNFGGLKETTSMFSQYCETNPTEAEIKFIQNLVKFAEVITSNGPDVSSLFIDSSDFVEFVAEGWYDNKAALDEISDAFDYGFNGEPNHIAKLANKNGSPYNHYIEYLEDAYSWGKSSAKILKQFGLTQADFN